jgi:cytochrome c oxidase subunit 4
MEAPPTQAHGHGTPSADHVPHVLPIAQYVRIWGALLLLTGLTLAVSYVDMGSANIAVALLIATAKASLVAAVFMHLRYDHPFHAVIIGSSLIFLCVFIGFTLFDTDARGVGDRVRADGPVDMKNPFAGSRSERQLRDKYATKP